MRLAHAGVRDVKPRQSRNGNHIWLVTCVITVIVVVFVAVRVSGGGCAARPPAGGAAAARGAGGPAAAAGAGGGGAGPRPGGAPPLPGPLVLRIAPATRPGTLAVQVINHGNRLSSVSVSRPGRGWQRLAPGADGYWSGPLRPARPGAGGP